MARHGRDRPDRDDRAGGISDSEFAGLILNEEFVRAAQVKEPAAAERDTMGPIAAPPRPPRLRLSTPPQTGAPLAWLRRRMASIVILVLVAAMVAGSIGPLASRRPAAEPDDGAGDQPARPEVPPPFAGTPATQFADNTAGLVLPPAIAVDGFETAEVALGLHAVRRALVHGNLDETVTTGASPVPYLDVVGPETATRLQAALAGGTPGASGQITRFPPEGVELAADVPVKVAGTFRYRASSPGVLAIDSRHIFAYATVAAGGKGPVEVVVVRREMTWHVTRTAEGSLSLPEIATSDVATSGHCLVDDGGYVWPRFTAPHQPARGGADVPVDWNVDEPLAAGTDCFLPVATHT